jgi:hypothetical protein
VAVVLLLLTSSSSTPATNNPKWCFSTPPTCLESVSDQGFMQWMYACKQPGLPCIHDDSCPKTAWQHQASSTLNGAKEQVLTATVISYMHTCCQQLQQQAMLW